MTSSQQSFTTEDMNALVKAFDWGKDNFTQTRTSVNGHVQSIEGNWMGQAPQAFGQAMTVFDGKLQKMINDCQELIRQLTSAGATYDTMVADTSQAGTSLQSAMEAGV